MSSSSSVLGLAFALAGVASFSSACGCAEQRAAGVPPVHGNVQYSAKLPAGRLDRSAPFPAPSAAVDVDGALDAASGPSWVDAVRFEHWADAARLLDALPEAELAKPEMRYVRARVALSLADYAKAAPLLADLEKSLPDFESEIVRRRAEAGVEVGPFAESAAFFAKSPRADDLARAARAYLKAGDKAQAQKAADRALYAATRAKNKRHEAQARMVRGALRELEGKSFPASIEFRWVALNVPTSPDAAVAAEALERLGRPLSARERDRIPAAKPGAAASEAAELVMTPAPRPDAETPQAPNVVITGTTSSPDIVLKPGLPKGERLHQRAYALLKARSYAEAGKAFLQALEVKGREAEQRYMAGKCMARAGQPDEAIEQFRAVASKAPKTAWGEKAHYMLARALMERGKCTEALQAYAKYMRQYPKGEHREEVEYERALATLASDAPRAARRMLNDLANKSDSVLQAGLLRELEGVAAMRAGDKEDAIRIWSTVVRSYPLSFAALVARTRIAEAGATMPPLLEPSASSRPASGIAVTLPPVAAVLASVGFDHEAEAHLASRENALASRYAGHEGEALCTMYGQLATGRRRYRVGVHHVASHVLSRAPADGDRWAWECVFPKPYLTFVRDLERTYAIPQGLVHAVMRQESAFDPRALSPATAAGLMQLMPATASKAAAEIPITFESSQVLKPDVNMRIGSYYLGKLLKMFDQNYLLSTAAYNAGPSAVSGWVSPTADNEIDVWVAKIPYTETRGYVQRVASNLARYQFLEGGESAVTPIPLKVPSDIKVPADAY